MYKEWIDEIMSTEELPDYEFSPFPKPSTRTEFESGNAATMAKDTSLTVLLPTLLFWLCKMNF